MSSPFGTLTDEQESRCRPVARRGRPPARGRSAPRPRDHPRGGRASRRVDHVEDADLRLQRGTSPSFNPSKTVVSIMFHRDRRSPATTLASKGTASSSAPCGSPTSTSWTPVETISRGRSAPGAPGKQARTPPPSGGRHHAAMRSNQPAPGARDGSRRDVRGAREHLEPRCVLPARRLVGARLSARVRGEPASTW